MRTWAVLFRRELAAYFLSLVGYLVMVFFLVVMGAAFAFLLLNFRQAGETESRVTEWFFSGFLFWMPMLIVPPILTMRLFSEEKSSGTIETLLTAPVTDWQVVLAKFFGALAFFIVLWLPTLGFVALTRFFSGPGSAPLDITQLAAGYVGTFLVGGLFLAIGCLASALTRNQIIAALLAFAVVLLIFLIGFLGWFARQSGSPYQAALSYASAIEHMMEFARGRVDVRRLVFYLSTTAVFLLAAKLILEARKWR